MTTGKRLFIKVAPFAKMVHGIAHPHRVAILYILSHDPTWVKDLVNSLGLPENLVSHHLKIMCDTGWLHKERDGQHVVYSINQKNFRELPKILADTPLWRNKKW